MPLSFISVSILCEFAMLPDVYILPSPQDEGTDMHIWHHIHQKIKSFVCYYISMPG